ncbi:PX domain-containing protein EREL2-like isoform X2 [Phalaenopsis equestris]|uniref:PX domain-containing protein EREL2-like isoform X2 n=1 Tax=Phalaenopsis equestris TaxID=78828 RepID=UPI0009E2E3E4|nr:PX domain-containing protein EREL2-like isoform X2 [Phalaenopsis equestris]
MPRSSPPKHRHDGTSPLPLGMDWSPPPRKWEGRNTIWPHDSRTGWSYCVMVPSWMVETASGRSNDTLLNPIIFYRILIGLQSPEGVSSSHDILRRFSDFLKLFSALKRAFPKKNIPPAPPKHALMRINSSRLLLEQRRRALEEWIGKLLCDIDLSRSAPIATFLELEAAARSSFVLANGLPSEASTSVDAATVYPRRSSSSASAECSTIASNAQSIASDASSDITCNKFDAEINNGIMAVAAMFDQPEDLFNANLPQRKDGPHSGCDSSYKSSSKQMFIQSEIVDSNANLDHDKLSYHSRRLSSDSIGSDASSIRASELLIPGATSLVWDGSVTFSDGVLFPSTMEASSIAETQFANDLQIILPIDQRQKLNRVLLTMQRRLATAKTDMEDIIARLNQELTIKEYLTMKVKDLEVELEVTKQRNKDNLQQAILLERERFTQTQWDMDELHRKYLELESKLKFEQCKKTCVESENTTASNENDILNQELSTKQEQITNLERQLDQLEMKSKADIKVLVKEIKFLRNSQEELKKTLEQSAIENDDLERVLQNNKQKWKLAKATMKNLLHDCEILRHQLQGCSVTFLSTEEDHFSVNPESLSDALELLATSDNRLGLLIAEAQLLAQEDEETNFNLNEMKAVGPSEDVIAICDGDPVTEVEGMRRMLISTIIDNAMLRKQSNSVFRCALKTISEPRNDDGNEVPSQKTMLNRFLRR